MITSISSSAGNLFKYAGASVTSADDRHIMSMAALYEICGCFFGTHWQPAFGLANGMSIANARSSRQMSQAGGQPSVGS